MTPVVWCLLALAVVSTVAAWTAVFTTRPREARWAGAAATGVLIAFVAVGDTGPWPERALFLLALALALARDLLGLKSPHGFRWAMGAALLSHAAFTAGFQQAGWSWLWATAGITVVLGATLRYAVPIVMGTRDSEPVLTLPVVAYTAVLSLMVAAASATGRPAAVAGAFLFYAADTLIGWNRFVRPTPYAEVTTAVSYRLALLFLAIAA